MSALNNAMNVIGTAAALKSVFGGTEGKPPAGRMSNFMSEMRRVGVARTNLFEIEITPPKCMIASTESAQKISLYAEGAALPGRSIETQEFARYGYGPNEKFPYSMQFQDYTVQFIGDGQGEIYKFFYNWMHQIVRGDQPVNNDSNGYEVGFREDYSVDINLRTYNEQGDTILATKMTNAFPIQVPDVSLSWGESSMMQFSVTFAYTQAELLNAATSFVGKNGGPPGLSTFQKLVKIGTAVQAIAAIRRPRSIQEALSSTTNAKNILTGGASLLNGF